jgi:hypothetical protein
MRDALLSSNRRGSDHRWSTCIDTIYRLYLRIKFMMSRLLSPQLSSRFFSMITAGRLDTASCLAGVDRGLCCPALSPAVARSFAFAFPFPSFSLPSSSAIRRSPRGVN